MQNKTSPPSEVVELLNEAIKLSPDSCDSYQTFSGYYMAKSEWVLAGKMYQKALEHGGEVYPELIRELKKHKVSIDVGKAKKRLRKGD